MAVLIAVIDGSSTVTEPGQGATRGTVTDAPAVPRWLSPNACCCLRPGDPVFPGGPGRTTNPTDVTSLMDDLEGRIFGRLDDDTWFYPGHGKDGILGADRPQSPEWRAHGW